MNINFTVKYLMTFWTDISIEIKKASTTKMNTEAWC